LFVQNATQAADINTDAIHSRCTTTNGTVNTLPYFSHYKLKCLYYFWGCSLVLLFFLLAISTNETCYYCFVIWMLLGKHKIPKSPLVPFSPKVND